MSNAVERPVCPCSSRYLNRSLVSSAVPNPANWRIVHNRPRYIDGYTPRVNGNAPGNPTGSSTPPTPAGRSRSVYNAPTGSPDNVTKGTSRSPANPYSARHSPSLTGISDGRASADIRWLAVLPHGAIQLHQVPDGTRSPLLS